MGVRGLTNYIYQKSDLYFDEITLKDCTVIIDGNSLVASLYNSNLIYTSAFGGDYDKIAEVTEVFFKRLMFNKVNSIVVFDGSVEKRKLATIKTRFMRKVISLQDVTPTNVNCNCFPLLLRQSMKDKLVELNIVVLQTDFEADSEIAALSKMLHAPVLSNDSDYFIFDVLYIPIPTLTHGNGVKSDVYCKLFRMDKFLKHLDLDRNKLPLLAAVLGNDYINRSRLSPFLGQIKLGKSRRSSYTQRVIVGVLKWLKSQSVESSLQKILSCVKLRSRERLGQKINNIMSGYIKLSTTLRNYIPNDFKVVPFNIISDDSISDQLSDLVSSSDKDSDSETDSEDGRQEKAIVEEKIDKSSSDVKNTYYSSAGTDTEIERVSVADVQIVLTPGELNEEIVANTVLPEWFVSKFRTGRISPSTLTLLNLKMYFSNPQPECYELPYAAEPYTYILQCIGGLLIGKSPIHFWHRKHRNKYEREMIETVVSSERYGSFPTLDDLEALDLKDRKLLFNDIMNVDDSFLNNVPDKWKLYFIVIAHWLQNDVNGELRPFHRHSVIMMMVAFFVVDENLGIFRLRKSFIKKYGVAVAKLTKSREKYKIQSSLPPSSNTLIEDLKLVTKEDCIIIVDALLPYFQIDRQTHNPKHFSNSIIHSFARLQNCFDYVSILNAVLLSPYPNMNIHRFYNGTFLYNFASNFRKRTNILTYLDTFFFKAPSLRNVYHKMYSVLQTVCPEMCIPKYRSKKTRKINNNPPTESEGIADAKTSEKFDSDSEPFFDRNNRFTIFLH